MCSEAGNTPMPDEPKVASRALSSNSPTTWGVTPWRSNHWSSRSRTEACAVGNNTGMWARLWGKLWLACASHAGGAYQPMADEPSAWL